MYNVASPTDDSTGRDNAFLVNSSVYSDGTRAISNVSGRDDTFASLPFVEATGDSMELPSDEARSFDRGSPTRKKDVFSISVDTQVRVAPHYIPRTSAPAAQPSKTASRQHESGYLPTSLAENQSSGRLMSGLRDLSLESAFEREGQSSSAYFAEESCLIGDVNGDSERATSLFLSMLTREDSFHADNSRTLSSHEITVVRPIEGGGFESPLQGRSKQMGSMASYSRALARKRRSIKEDGEGSPDGTGKAYYDSPTMQLQQDGSMYAVSPQGEADLGYKDNGDNGLAPLGGDWDTSERPSKGTLTKEMLDNPEANLNYIYDAAGRYLKVRKP